MVCTPRSSTNPSTLQTWRGRIRAGSGARCRGRGGGERMVQSGIPVSAYAGRPRMLALIEEAKRRSSIPATCDFEECIEATRQRGIRRVAVAAKWDAELMQRVLDYLAHAGIETVGFHNDPHSAEEVFALRPEESVEV